MATYTPIEKSTLQKIGKAYGLDRLSEVNSIEGGNANSSFLLTTDHDNYVLTVLEEKDLAQANDLAKLLRRLVVHHFPTSTVCLTKSGKLITQYKQKPILLKKWITGRVVKALNLVMLKEIGTLLAKLHLIPVPDFLPHGHAYGIQTFEALVNKGLDKDYETWLAKQLKNFENNLPKHLPKGLIHGDLFYDNILFDKNKVKAIIDFEEACCYYFAFDIGMSIIGLCRDKETINDLKVKSFLKGYEEIRPLTTSEKEHLKSFTEYAATATSSWRYWKYNFDSPSPKLNDKHWKMVKLAKQVNSLKNSSL